jgi:hypothetical protein
MMMVANDHEPGANSNSDTRVREFPQLPEKLGGFTPTNGYD